MIKLTFTSNVFSEILVPGSVHEIRLIDDAFGKICNGVTDLSMQVRTLACELLGTMKMVSPKFLTQTLDKKLMSNMRRKVRVFVISKKFGSIILYVLLFRWVNNVFILYGSESWFTSTLINQICHKLHLIWQTYSFFTIS